MWCGGRRWGLTADGRRACGGEGYKLCAGSMTRVQSSMRMSCDSFLGPAVQDLVRFGNSTREYVLLKEK